MKLAYAFALIPSLALATGGHPTPVPAPPASTSQSTSGAIAASHSNSHSSAGSWSEGGNATANGGSGGESSSDASSSSGGNALSVTTTAPRQTPGMGQGSFAIQGCAVAGNAGGSNVGGTGFLGVGFTTPQCYDFMLAQALAAIGQTKAACEVLRESKAGQRAKARKVVIVCANPPVVSVPPAPVSPPVDLSAYATKAEVNEKLERVYKATTSK